MNINIFCHLKLEFALAIPALNKWKIETNNSEKQGLINIIKATCHTVFVFKNDVLDQ